ncbi:hypothetical protein WAI453_011583 [Rhynchosporium graminicola]
MISRHSEHLFFVMIPLGALDQILFRLNFLHEANVTHTVLHSDNLLITIIDDSILAKVEEDEFGSLDLGLS